MDYWENWMINQYCLYPCYHTSLERLVFDYSSVGPPLRPYGLKRELLGRHLLIWCLQVNPYLPLSFYLNYPYPFFRLIFIGHSDCHPTTTSLR